MRHYPIIDLHCDLLGCVDSNPDSLNFESPDTNCSVPQLKAGGVKLQTLAVAALTSKGSAKAGERQVALYKQLLKEFPEAIAPFANFHLDSSKVHCIFAIENASALVEEDEPLDKAFDRLERFQAVEKILYVSLTWNHENRFGGGNASPCWIKRRWKGFSCIPRWKKHCH